jgi:hypothetical protein
VPTGTDEDGGRDLEWDGCLNARDFGGLPLTGGGVTPRGRVVRSDNPDKLTLEGWAGVWDFGVRTIVDLRREDECAAGVERPADLTMLRVSWDEYPDEDWNTRNEPPGMPPSMRAFLRDYPGAPADAARALIEAAPGAVLYHCAGGRDRSGLFTILLGALIGVTPDALFDDYRHSFERLLPYSRAAGIQQEIDFIESPDKAEHRARFFGEVRSVIAELDSIAAARVLMDGGLTEAQVDALRSRLVDGPS